VSESPILCPGCQHRPIGKNTGTLCPRCANPNGAKKAGGRKRIGEDLRVARNVSVDVKTQATFADETTVRPGVLLDACAAALRGGVDVLQLLDHELAKSRACD